MSDAGKRLIGAAKEALGIVKSHRSPKVTVEQAQAELPAPLAAEIMHDAWTNFQGIYDYKAIGWGCGPVQSVVGLAIKRGHLKIADATTPDTRDALIKELVAALSQQKTCLAMELTLRRNEMVQPEIDDIEWRMSSIDTALTRAKEAGYGAE